MNNKAQNTWDSRDEAQIQVHLTEYEKLRDEYVHVNSNMHQAVALALGSASIAIPLLLGQTANLSMSTIAGLLYFLTIVYAVITVSFASSAYSVGAISRYIHGYLEPEINRTIKSDKKHKVLCWETFARGERGTLIGKLVANAGSAAFTLMLLLPGAISLIAAHCVLSSPVPPAQQAAAFYLPSFLLVPLSIIAWVSYISAIASVLLATIYNLSRAKLFSGTNDAFEATLCASVGSASTVKRRPTFAAPDQASPEINHGTLGSEGGSGQEDPTASTPGG